MAVARRTISVSWWKCARAVRTPQSRIAVSIEEISLLRHGSPVSMSLKCVKKPCSWGRVLQWYRSVRRTCSITCAVGWYPRLSAIHRAERPNPVAAILAILRGSSVPVEFIHVTRSRTCPVWGFACSAKKRQPRRSRSSRKASSADVIERAERAKGSADIDLLTARADSCFKSARRSIRLLCDDHYG